MAKKPIPKQILKLIPKLASDNDGEVVATVKAIGRVLKSDELDWHDLANAIRIEPSPGVTLKWTAPPLSQSECEHSLNELWKDNAILSPKDRSVVSNMLTKARLFHVQYSLHDAVLIKSLKEKYL